MNFFLRPPPFSLLLPSSHLNRQERLGLLCVCFSILKTKDSPRAPDKWANKKWILSPANKLYFNTKDHFMALITFLLVMEGGEGEKKLKKQKEEKCKNGNGFLVVWATPVNIFMILEDGEEEERKKKQKGRWTNSCEEPLTTHNSLYVIPTHTWW